MRVVGSAFVAQRRIMFGPHAVDRFRQRIAPGLSFNDGLGLLLELASGGKLQREKPRGVFVNSLRDQILNEAYLTFTHAGRRAVFPLVPWPRGLAAPTCITPRGSGS